MGAVKRWVTAVAAVAWIGCGGGGDEGFTGLSADVEVVIDEMGVPHIYGATDADVFYAAGYQTAVDRMYQLELVRRRAQGRWAEVLGDEFAEDDRLARLFNWSGFGKKDAEGIRRGSPATWAVLEAWTAGVNRRVGEIERGEAPLPPGFDALGVAPARWETADPLIVARMIFFANDNVLEYEIFVTLLSQLQPELFERVEVLRPMFPVFALGEPPGDGDDDGKAAPPAAPPAGSPAGSRPRLGPARPRLDPATAAAAMRRVHRTLGRLRVSGSNNWAVDGAHTTSGRPLVANDPHQPLESPNLMAALHLSTAEHGGDLDAVGFGFVGIPGVQLGHNRHMVWAATTNFGDTMDIWDVEAPGHVVRLGGVEHAIVLREERIALRSGGELVELVADVPGVGVILPRDLAPVPVASPGREMLFSWAGYFRDQPRDLLAFDKARSVAEFEAAVDDLGLGFNFVFADAQGIAYRVGHGIPDRGPPAGRPAPWMLLPGDDPATVWTGALLPPEQLPHARGSARGFLATANNDPFGFTADGRVDDDPWYYGAFFDPGFRAQRIDSELTRLLAAGPVDEAAMKTLQTDVRSAAADALVPALAAAWARVPTDAALAEFRDRPELATLAELLGAWDRRMTRDSSAALVFHAWIYFATQRTVGDELGAFFEPALETAGEFAFKITAQALLGSYDGAQDVLAGAPGGADGVMLAALADVAAWLIATRGGVDPAAYAWGDVHGTHFQSVFPGQLDAGFVATDGGFDTINVAHCLLFPGGEAAERCLAPHGAIFRLVAGFDEDGTPRADVAMAMGQSADPGDPHFDDWLGDWAAGAYRPLPFRRAEVDAARARSYVLPRGAK